MNPKKAWAPGLCVVAGLGLFLPWHQWSPSMGMAYWQAGAIGSVLFLTLLFLVATEPLDPKPLWRPIVTGSAGATALVFFNLYAYGPGQRWAFYLGPWVTLIAVMGLIVVASLELRQILGQRRGRGS